MPAARLALILVLMAGFLLPAAGSAAGLKGRIAYSADGNHNDPDDWAASPIALAILAEAGVRDRLTHFDYNSILPQTNPEWERAHAASVTGAARRYGYRMSRFFDCRRQRDAAVNSIARAINRSSASDPLYLIIAGPVEIPLLGIRKSDPARRKFVYCISHSQWNDGFAPGYTFSFTSRAVIAAGVNWVQIQEQNRLLAFGRFGQPARPEEFQPYFWMRDSADAAVRFLWERMTVSTRPDPSDAGMAYFLVTGDEQADPVKLERLIGRHCAPAVISARDQVRIEAENFTGLDGYEVEYRNDRQASHRVSLKPASGVVSGRIGTRFDEPYTSASASYDVEVRYRDEGEGRLALHVNGVSQGEPWRVAGGDGQWRSRLINGVRIRRGDLIAIEARSTGGAPAGLDYVQLNRRP